MQNATIGKIYNHLLSKNSASLLVLFFMWLFMVGTPGVLNAAHGLSIDGKLKYEKGFERFEYTSSNAKKGGTLVLHSIGSYDKMNPYTLKGTHPLGLSYLVFETLGVSSLDEPFTKYGLIAEDIVVADDKLSMLIKLDARAKFSDGSAITTDDVLFSLNIMKSDKSHPLYGEYFRDIIKGEIIDKHHIKFFFSKVNRELPMIALEIPVFSKQFFSSHTFDGNESLVAPLGSGPYIVEKFNHGNTITYKRNFNHWAREKNVNNGMYNFDQIVVKYFKDPTVAVEAFKAGEFDAQLVNIAKQWARDMSGKKFESGIINKRIFPHSNNAGLQGFVMNTRRAIFKDARVREAIGLAFNFEWTNKSIFFGQYTRNKSFFSNSELAAKGLPEGLELQYLTEFKENIPKRVFTTPLQTPVNDKKGAFRKNLRVARDLLSQAGWNIKDGVLKNNEGKSFEFEVLLANPSFNRVMAPYVINLEKLGIITKYRLLDHALYEERVQKFDFDMVVQSLAQSQSPGNEQKNYWHSTAADKIGSDNLAGIKDKIVDSFVNKIVYAQTQEELRAATRALDRILWYGFYVIPNWYVGGHRIVYYDKFNIPDIFPKYYNHFQFLMTWSQKKH